MPAEQFLAAQRATEKSEHFRVLMTLIRSRTDATAKGLAAVGTTAVGAIGYATLADFFPYRGPAIAVAGIGLGLLAMITAVVKLVQRFERLAETIITFPDAERTRRRSDLGDDEYRKLTVEYGEMAKLNEVGSLRAYYARAHRFERIAETSADQATANLLRARADTIRVQVMGTQDRAVVFILRERAKLAFFHRTAIAYLVLFLIGWYGTALSADAIQSKRAESEKPTPARRALAQPQPVLLPQLLHV
jgi:hypothetical protein